MGQKIRITCGEVSLTAELNDSPTAKAIADALPIRKPGNRWGEEIYFSIPVKMDEAEDARADMEVGELGYWPPGNAFCIFFGKTPVSNGNKPRAASPVNPIGQVEGDATLFSQCPNGAEVVLEKCN
ncbi:MAG: hypothetical protein KatS3mg105_1786 [Gemmatales bacterium]|nr:MAG: hypothetical protein KatS3mg105_1786 [Gemmatales bacterium]